MASKPKSLRFLKNQITNIENKAKNADGVSIYSVRHYLNELDAYFIEFAKYYEGDISEIAEKEYIEYDERYQNAKSLLLERIDTILQRTPGEALNESSNTDKSVAGLLEVQNELLRNLQKMSIGGAKNETSRLPFLKIPVFKGDIKEWVKFRNLFRSIVHDNKNLSDVEKMNHLLSLVDGEPLSLIRHFPISGENYKDAMSVLEREYENDYLLVQNMVSELVSLPCMDGKTCTLRSLWGILSETIQSLDNMGPYGQSRNSWVIHLITSKFSRDIAKKWAESVVGDSQPDVESLIEFLREMCTAERLLGSNSKPKPAVTIKGMSATISKCFVCGDRHKIFRCDKFLALTIKDRDKLVKDQSRCINCLGTGHFSTKCIHKGSCFHCRKRHHTLLHFGNNMGTSGGSAGGNEKDESNFIDKELADSGLVKAHFALDARPSSAILPTAIVEILNGFGKFQKCRVLLDCGAQASFITERCFRTLNLLRNRVRIPVQFMSGSNSFQSKGSVCSTFRGCSSNSKTSKIILHILPKLTDQLPDTALRLSSVDLLKRKFELADPHFDMPAGIDLIIGADHFFGIVGAQKYHHQVDNLWVSESNLGWLVSGGSILADDRVLSINNVSHPQNMDDVIERFWQMEEPVSSDDLCPEDKICEQVFEQTTIRKSDGKYCVELPFKEPKVQFGDSLRMSLNRFQSLEKRFSKDSEYYDKYKALIELFLNEGYLEAIPLKEIDKPIEQRFYLPHYGVCRSDQNYGTLRIVFDASAKSDNGLSLNDCILTGPKYQAGIFDILQDFRCHRYVFTADVQKMYRQIQISENHRDFQRILWRSSKDGPIQHFRLCTLMDGVNAAPYLALRTMKRLASDEADNYPMGARVLSNRYMDDFFVGGCEITELVTIRNDLIKILASAGMTLNKWASNDDRVLVDIEGSRRQCDSSIELEHSAMIKTLGVIWDCSEDCFTFFHRSGPLVGVTKRSLLSESARIFDPCGWITPITVRLKILFQKTWLGRIGWDDELPESIKSEWLIIRSDLGSLSNLRIPRFYGNLHSIEVHGFCDASTMAYAAVVYIRSTNNEGEIYAKIAASKTKLCPIKPMSIARLELCGAQLLAKLIKSMSEFNENYKPPIFCWSDSNTVLAWLASHPSKWKSFIANRCAHINELLPGIPWNYVRSESNPADVATRGLLPARLVNNEFWWHGPSWLVEDWHSFYRNKVFNTTDEMKITKVNVNHAQVVPFFVSFVERFSCFRRFRRSFAYVIRFIDFIKNRNQFRPRALTTSDVSTSTEVFIKMIQRFSFGEEVDLILAVENLSKSNRLYGLSPFVDDVGLLRVGGRLSEAIISYDTKHPIIIPHGHFLELLIRYVHERYYHAGPRLTMSLLKQNYYVLGMRSIVKRVIGKCVVCVRMKGKTYQPMMSDLPGVRLNFRKPFETIGIDFAGPVTIRPYVGKGRITKKGYISVMICLATKAVHLELVTSLSTEALVMALKRFFSRYGHCETVFSDNGRNFVGCARILKELKNHVNGLIESPDVKKFLIDNLISWKFIPPFSPHFGGIWEAAVKSAKFHLSRLFLGRVPTFEEMSTALAEIAAILNSRPISALTDDLDDLNVLTPSHLVHGYPTAYLPILKPSFRKSTDSVGRYGAIGSLISLFWKKWRNEFFQEYMRRVKWKFPGRKAEVGDLVLIKRFTEYPCNWLRGRIVKLYRGCDEEVRVVDVKTPTGIRKESVRNLVPLLLKHDASIGGVCLDA